MTGTNLYIDWNELEKVGITRKSPVTVHVRNVSIAAGIAAVMASISSEHASAEWSCDQNVLTNTARPAPATPAGK